MILSGREMKLDESLVKLFTRQIKNTKSRFVSIMVIVALGVGFFVGVKGASPSMKHSADKFFKENNLMDYKIMSSYGFREEDIESLKNMEGVKAIMPSYSTELLVKSNENLKKDNNVIIMTENDLNGSVD